ncbi:MAG: YraN family protein [Gemmatimonadaceae bacterium]|nr:YraN family protein [Gemmatimonadaceae bacterium]
MTQHNQRLGRWGERIAAKWLERDGWVVRERRWRDGRRDIDLIAEREGVVAFIEVKARSGEQFGDPVEAVHLRKQRELIRAARVWMARHGVDTAAYRFDVVGVPLKGRSVWIRHIPSAFEVGR